jgi:DNA end-binding protein Ku
MYYHNEIVDHKEIKPPQTKMAEAELEMATSLVKTMAITFKPAEYKDQYQEALKEMVKAKLKGVEPRAIEEPKIEIPDLMTALRASIEASKKKPVQREAVRA